MIMKIKIEYISKNGRTLLLAYDHGIEHGPVDFNKKTIDPYYVLDIAKKGGFTGIILQKGVAEKYYGEKYKKVPLILKLNGKTNIYKGEPVSLQICSVKEAVDIGAKAVGYTIYIGSEFESKMLHEFGKIEEEAHDHGLPVIVWMYPRGKAVKTLDAKKIAYAARVGLEIGADFIKVKYTGSIESFKNVVRAAGKCGVLCLGGERMSESKILKTAHDCLEAGAVGMAVGRNIWQHKEPVKMARALGTVVLKNKTAKEALKILK